MEHFDPYAEGLINRNGPIHCCPCLSEASGPHFWTYPYDNAQSFTSTCVRYPLVIKKRSGESPFLMGKPSKNIYKWTIFQFAMLNNQRVSRSPIPTFDTLCSEQFKERGGVHQNSPILRSYPGNPSRNIWMISPVKKTYRVCLVTSVIIYIYTYSIYIYTHIYIYMYIHPFPNMNMISHWRHWHLGASLEDDFGKIPRVNPRWWRWKTCKHHLEHRCPFSIGWLINNNRFLWW